MTTQQTNGNRRPSRDPDWRRTRDPQPNGFHPFTVQADSVLLACSSCAGLIPNTDRARQVHREHHATVDAGLPR